MTEQGADIPEGADSIPQGREIMPVGTLAGAICQVMADVGPVIASGYNKHDSYAYASGDDIMAPVQKALARAGLAIIPLGVDHYKEGVHKGRNSELRRITFAARYRLLHTSGESVDVQVCGEGADRLDKAVAKTYTGAYKVLLKQVFCIASVDEPPAEDEDGGRRAAPPRIQLDQPVTPGKEGNWSDLKWSSHLEWVQDAAAGRLAEQHPDIALYRHPEWIAHAAAAAKVLHHRRRAAKRLAQVSAHLSSHLEDDAGERWEVQREWLLASMPEARRAPLGDRAGTAAELEEALLQADLSHLKSVLAAAGFDVAAPVSGFESRAVDPRDPKPANRPDAADPAELADAVDEAERSLGIE